MSDSIIIAIITGGITLAGNLLANHSATKKAAVEQAKRDQKIDDSIHELDRKVASHNAYAEKMANILETISTIQKDIEWLKKTGEK